MTKKTNTKKVKVEKAVELTPVQKLEKYLLENKLFVGVQAVHDQMWRKQVVAFACKVLGVKLLPYVYPIVKK